MELMNLNFRLTKALAISKRIHCRQQWTPYLKEISVYIYIFSSCNSLI